eukprot:264027-Pyramimonas_sp.AAC.1
MVGGLVEQQQVGLGHADHGEDEARLLPLGQLPDLHRLHLAAHAVPPQEGPPLVHLPLERERVRVRIAEKVQALRTRQSRQSVSRSVSQSVSQPVGQASQQTVGQSASRSGKSVSRYVLRKKSRHCDGRQPVSQSVSQPVGHPERVSGGAY